MRTKLVAANWKMYGSLEANALWVRGMLEAGAPACDVAVCVPHVYLAQMRSLLQGSYIALGAEDVHEAPEGAFTGDVSAKMLADIGAEYVIVGHSERRGAYAESDARVALKAKVALEAGLRPIVCVGESLEERESSQTIRVVARQITAVMTELGAENFAKCTVAYEPIWAIGTGKSATPEIAQQVHRALRGEISLHFAAVADSMRILYGGSVKPGNAAELFAMPDIDGALVGGASLKAQDFYAICSAVK